jgi:hypothetical protein
MSATVTTRRVDVRRLYEDEGKTIYQVADELGMSHGTVWRDVQALGISRPNGRPAVELVCHTCGNRFTRAPSLTIDPRTGEPFARHFCSRACLSTARLVPCAFCGKEVRRIPAELDHEHVCCSRKCTAQLRRKLGLPQLIAPNWGGSSRRIWKLKWAPKPGRPRLDSHPEYDAKIAEIQKAYVESYDEATGKYASERALASLTGTTRYMVGIALGKPL